MSWRFSERFIDASDETGFGADLPLDKSGCVRIVGSVPLLHPEVQTVDEMLEGWRNQQMCGSQSHDTIAGRIRLVERFVGPISEFRR
jgi:integrase/recombinase XerD